MAYLYVYIFMYTKPRFCRTTVCQSLHQATLTIASWSLVWTSLITRSNPTWHAMEKCSGFQVYWYDYIGVSYFPHHNLSPPLHEGILIFNAHSKHCQQKQARSWLLNISNDRAHKTCHYLLLYLQICFIWNKIWTEGDRCAVVKRN